MVQLEVLSVFLLIAITSGKKLSVISVELDLISDLLIVFCADYSYDSLAANGPPKWGKINPNCDGSRQSPVDLSLKSGVPVFTSNPFRINDIEKRPQYVKFSNKGYGIVVTFDYADGKQPTITGGPLQSNTYVLDHLHLHFQSEHTVNGITFDAEVHLVHYNSKYSSLQDAMKYPDGLAVLGVLFYVS